jgi:hypothetical protein
MVHGETERDCADSDQSCLLGDQQAGHGRPGLQLRWLGEICPHPAHGSSVPLGGPVPLGASGPQVDAGPLGGSGPQVGAGPLGPDAAAEHGSSNLVPRQRAASAADGAGWGRDRSTCRTDRSGWAGAHRHGAVRPRSRNSPRERPPRRWC